jgi:hypothetical protein
MAYIILGGHWCYVIVLNVCAPTEAKIDDVEDSFYKELEREFDKLPKYYMNMLGDFSSKVGREHIFKLTIRIESLHEISNDSGVRVVNFATSKNQTVKSTRFPHHIIHKYTWMSPDGKPHSQIEHILIRQRHASVLDV